MMYRTYTGEEEPKEASLSFEERLIPKEVKEEVKICGSSGSQSNTAANPLSGLLGGVFNGIELDDLLILGLLILLFYENCEDNILIIILVALLFMK